MTKAKPENILESKTLTAVYNPFEKTLTAVFSYAPDTVYTLHKVPASKWEAMKQAESIGRFYGQELKDKYRTEKVFVENID
jgi:hypothetical protein